MSDEKTDLLCPHCNQTFSTFLRELAAKNLKVVCPNCGNKHDGQPPEPATLKKAPSAR